MNASAQVPQGAGDSEEYRDRIIDLLEDAEDYVAGWIDPVVYGRPDFLEGLENAAERISGDVCITYPESIDSEGMEELYSLADGIDDIKLGEADLESYCEFERRWYMVIDDLVGVEPRESGIYSGPLVVGDEDKADFLRSKIRGPVDR